MAVDNSSNSSQLPSNGTPPDEKPTSNPSKPRTSKHSDVAKAAMLSNANARCIMASPSSQALRENNSAILEHDFALPYPLIPHSNQLTVPSSSTTTTIGGSLSRALQEQLSMTNSENGEKNDKNENGVHRSLSDTPPRSATSTAPGSPRIPPVRQNSGTATPRIRPPATTLNIPGMTKSRISPDGMISNIDVGAKLVIIMVGLPARGKSYITKKLRRYLAWQQHKVRIFNVGNRRRVAAGTSPGPVSPPSSPPRSSTIAPSAIRTTSIAGIIDAPTQAAHILLNGVDPAEEKAELAKLPSADTMEQSATFFDPKNEAASRIREQVALSTCDELLDYILNDGGAIGILDATNSTIERRQTLFKHIKAREPKIGILFIESVCEDQKLLEANMHLKLKGPDYKDKDPESSLADFKKRVKAYESAYVPLGEFEDKHNMMYIQMIDVGRKIIQHQTNGFLVSGIATYLSTFNLAPRQIWITRHGQSVDNLTGKIGGDSEITEEGQHYATVLYNFIDSKRNEWTIDQKNRAIEDHHLPLGPGDRSPPYPEGLGELDDKNFCVWTSMLKRSIQTAEAFQQDENYDVKSWTMLDELDAGDFEGLTYAEIEARFPEQYAKRKADKLSYIYPGVGGEGYLQVINRLKDMVREIERIKDHVLVIAHRSVCRVLMAYFMDLTRDDIADLDVPLGMLYSIETKPYGIEFHAYRYNEGRDDHWTFEEVKDYKPARATHHTA